jgi:hypothetical protein
MSAIGGRSSAPLFALGGPLLIGALLGVPFGLESLFIGALELPAVLFGVALFMTPALYIGVSLCGVAPGVGAVLSALGRGLWSCGVLLLGLAPLLAFLLATNRGETAAGLFGFAAVFAGALAGLRALYAALLPEAADRRRAALVFAAWALVSLGIGARLFVGVLTALSAA